MTAEPINDVADAESRVRAGANEHVKVGVFDIDGLLRGKFMHRDKFSSALADGFGFCDVVLGWDSNDQLYDNTQLTGWDTGFPDAQVRVLPETGRQIPFEDDRWLFLGEFSGAAEAVCPRGVLRRVLSRADAMGYLVNVGFEYEIFVFEETPHSVRDKHYRDLRPVAPGNTGYSMLRVDGADFHNPACASIITTAREMVAAGQHVDSVTVAVFIDLAIFSGRCRVDNVFLRRC